MNNNRLHPVNPNKLLAVVSTKTRVNLPDVVPDVLGVPYSHRTSYAMLEMAGILRNHGWYSVKDGKNTWWVAPDSKTRPTQVQPEPVRGLSPDITLRELLDRGFGFTITPPG